MPNGQMKQLGEVGLGLIQNLLKAGEARADIPMKIGELLLEQTPLNPKSKASEVLGQLILQSSGIPQAQQQQKQQQQQTLQAKQKSQGLPVTPTEGFGEEKPELNPYMKGAETALKKAGTAGMEDAITQVGPERATAQFEQMAQQSMLQAQQPQQPQKKPAINPLKLLKNIVQDVVNIIPASPQARMASVAERQLAQAPEIEKLKIKKELLKTEATTFEKRRGEFWKAFDTPMTAETNKVLSQVESALTGIDTINNLLGVDYDQKTGEVRIKNAQLLRNQNFLNKNRQQLIRARDIVVNKTLRRDSGAAIGEKELKDYKKITGFEVGWKSFVQNPEVIAKVITESQQQLLRDRNRLVPNEQRKKEVQELLKKYSRDEITELYSKLGEL